ncbi:hypothetical protein F4810DRAFT_415687 [Camillea tinctor]|nr:hypothetical protein F4810DRAFT_415687 [Camillea tinctor]
METTIQRCLRVIWAVPFLSLASWSFRRMDLQKLAALHQAFSQSGFIERDGDKVYTIDHFNCVEYINDIWRAIVPGYSASTFGYDDVASWQIFSFLIDLGPLYAIWILEANRDAIYGTPACFLPFFTIAAQFLGIGPVAPVFYFLYIAFGPTSAEFVGVDPLRHTHRAQGTTEYIAVLWSYMCVCVCVCEREK